MAPSSAGRRRDCQPCTHNPILDLDTITVSASCGEEVPRGTTDEVSSALPLYRPPQAGGPGRRCRLFCFILLTPWWEGPQGRSRREARPRDGFPYEGEGARRRLTSTRRIEKGRDRSRSPDSFVRLLEPVVALFAAAFQDQIDRLRYQRQAIDIAPLVDLAEHRPGSWFPFSRA